MSAQPFSVEHFRAWARKLLLDNGEPWIVEAFFAAFVADYFSGVPESWLIVPEGNSKTTSLAGLAIYLLEHRACASIPWAASSRDQAEIGYRQAEGFVLRSRRLRGFLKCQEGYRRIKNLETGGRIQVFAADDRTGDGVIPTDAFLDELHRHRDLRLYRTWSGKLGKRDGQMAAISTAGEPGDEFEEMREKIRQTVPVAERRPGFVLCRSSQIVLHEWAVDEAADVEDMQVVKEANPFSGITVESLALKRATPTMTISHWRRFVCNLPTRGELAAITEQEWAMAASEERIPEGSGVWLGLDVAWKWDTTALVPLWMPSLERRLLGVPVVLEPPRDGSSLNPAVVENALAGLAERFRLETVVMDTSRAEQLAEWIRSELDVTVVDRAQSNTLACLDYERFMEALRMGWLKHPGDLVLTRHALSASVKLLPGGDTRFWKPQVAHTRGVVHDRRVIDALVAAAMVHSTAVAAMSESPKLPPRVIDLSGV